MGETHEGHHQHRGDGTHFDDKAATWDDDPDKQRQSGEVAAAIAAFPVVLGEAGIAFQRHWEEQAFKAGGADAWFGADHQALLGPDYDDELKRAYTEITPDDIYKDRFALAIPFSTSVATTGPLEALIARFATDAVIDAIGEEHRKGRRLFVGTVSLDRPGNAIWDMGAIAAGDAPGLLTAIVEASAKLTARLIAAGFVHGVLNTDNLNVTGESFDYGPWRWAPTWAKPSGPLCGAI